MKRTTMGGIFMFAGTILFVGIAIAAVGHMPDIMVWEGRTELVSAIFGGGGLNDSANDSLMLSLSFAASLILSFYGFVLLYEKKFKNGK